MTGKSVGRLHASTNAVHPKNSPYLENNMAAPGPVFDASTVVW